MKTKRQLNIEVLRILAMLLVLLMHNHQVGQVTQNLVRVDLLKAIGLAEIKSWTFTCVPSFVVISGYFGIKWKWKGLFNYLFQIAFWGVFIYLITWGMGFHDFSTLKIMKNMLCFLHDGNWFFVAYLGLYMLSPILNAFIESASEKKMQYMTLAFFCFQTIFGWMLKHEEFYYGLTTTSLIGWYLIGGMLRKTTLRCFHLSAYVNFLIFLGVGLLCVVVNILTKYVGIEKDIYSYISPLQVVQTTYLFLFFKELNITRGERIITFFSSSAFAGLLIHSWEGAEMYSSGLKWIYDNLSAPFVISMVYIIVIFAVACVLDKVRIWVWDRVLKVCCPSK